MLPPFGITTRVVELNTAQKSSAELLRAPIYLTHH